MARVAEEKKSIKARMLAARRYSQNAFGARNELIAVLARLWPSHLMPVKTGPLATLQDARPETAREAICIHSPAGILCWIVSPEEVDQYFKFMGRITESHWNRTMTAADRSARLALLPEGGEPTTVPDTRTNDVERVTSVPVAPLEPRRPGDFSRRRRRS